MKSTWVAYRRMLSLLPPGGQRFVVAYAVMLGVLAVLDAGSLAILAVIITPLVSNSTVSVPLLGEVEGVGLLILLGLVCALLVLKSVFSALLIWLATRRFAHYEVAIGNTLLDAYLQSTWSHRLTKNSSDIVRIADRGIASAIGGFLLPGATLIGEALTFVSVLVVLTIAQPFIAIVAVGYLGLVGTGMFYWVTKRSRQSGNVVNRSSLRVSRLLTEMVTALKEITLRGKADEVAQVVKTNRMETARARSNLQFLAAVPRYIIDAALVGGFVLVGFVGYLLGGMVSAITAVAIFALAGFRMAPSLQRFQNIVSVVSGNSALAQAVIADIDEANAIRVGENEAGGAKDLDENPQVLTLDNVSFQYNAESALAVDEVSLSIPFGSSVAIVGPSGAGKSTIVDLILSLLRPTSGTITIDGKPLEQVTAAWRARVGYVPQEVALFDGTVGQNVALSWTPNFDRERVVTALHQAQLLNTIEARKDGIDSRVGERGLGLSGGQRQRLGIARALYSDPLVLVMDEATSSLDTTTEAAVAEAIKSLRGKVTTVTVAHRLATIKDADQIFFMSEGRLTAKGTFRELLVRVPEFAQQARFAGLTAPNSETGPT